jgi:glucose/arabinose dehydrogenase
MNLRLLIVLLAATLAGCGGSDSNESVTPDTAGAYFPLPDTSGAPIDSEKMSFHVQTVVEGLSVPWGITFLPDGIVLITERQGSLRIVRDGQLDSVPVGGAPEVFAQGQGGLLDIAAHPDYAENGWLYITYSIATDDGSHTALMRARLDLDAHSLVDREFLFSGEPKTTAGHHYGSRVVFRDGFVFVSSGDRGVMDEAQNLSSHNGTVIRLHNDGRVPDDNPFVNEADAQPETWSYGHRNVQGMAINPQTGDIWAHEHGPRGGDEINIVREGRNYGWPEITYGVNYDGTAITEDTEREGMEQPVVYWVPSIAPSGMAFADGERYPEWNNNVMVGALAGQELRRVELDGNTVTHQETLLQGRGRIRDVKTGPDGYLYLADESSGAIIRLVPAD